MTICLPKKIMEDLERVRASSLANMYALDHVQRVANDLKMYALVVWLEDQRDKRNSQRPLSANSQYARILQGEEMVEETLGEA